METINYGHGGEPAQGSNAAKTAQGELQADAALDQRKADAAQTERQGMPNPAAREHQELKVAEEPSGYRGDNWSTAGPGGTSIRSATPENATGHLNPSAPGDTGITPGTSAK